MKEIKSNHTAAIGFVGKWTKLPLGIRLFLIIIIIKFVFGFFPNVAEIVYRNGIFQLIRVIWDYSFGLIPIPWFPFFFAGIFLVILKNTKRIFSRQSLKLRVLRTLNFFGYLYFSFVLVWGMNYSCPTIKDKMEYSYEEISGMNLYANFDKTKTRLVEIRKDLPPSVITKVFIPDNEQDIIRENMESVLAEFGIQSLGQVSCKTISNNGWMRELGISGIYFPFSLESYVDGSQSTVTHIFSLAHELSHGYGITDEGEANFMAYLALSRSNESVFRYIAEIELMSYILAEIKSRDHNLYSALRASLPHWVHEDLNYIREKSFSHQNKFDWFSDQINDFYLKSNGVKDGIGSYSQLIGLVDFYESQEE